MSEYKRLTGQKWTDDIDLAKEYGYSYIYKRLYELEEKIENGTLREVPCKVGDTVYYINDYGLGQYKIIPFNVSGFKIGINNRLYVLFDFDSFAFAEDIFITKEAAEARLKELQEKRDI